MRRLRKTPKLDEQFYKEGVYKEPLHHVNNKQTPRLFLTAGLVNYLKHHYGIKEVTDLGCGDGGLLEVITNTSLGIRLAGIDLSKANVDYAKEHRPYLNIIHEDFTSIDKISSEVITCCETLEHLDDPKKLLKALDCKFLITSVPMNENARRNSPYHIWAWNEQEFQKTLKDCGFKILHTVRVNVRTQIVLASK